MLEPRAQRKKRTTPLLTFQPLAACRQPGKLATVGDSVTCLSRVSGGVFSRVAAMRDPLSLQLSEPGFGGREIRSFSGTILLPRAPVERRTV
jgi:hypothetical protein